mgnify:CR=1 FL=1
MLALWFGLRERLGRIGFYVLFGCVVTVSVQLVGLYPRVHHARRAGSVHVLYDGASGYLEGLRRSASSGYAAGLLASLWLDLPRAR